LVAGGEKLGCSLYEVPLGRRAWPCHYHRANEEAIHVLYGSGTPPDTGELEKMSEPWRPYRAWVALLLRVALEEEIGEIAGDSRRPVSRTARF
jgi:hypothetical protein